MISKQSVSSWRFALPETMREVAVPAPPECSAMAHLRGEIAPGAPAFGVVSTRPRDGKSAAQLAEKLARDLLEPAELRDARVAGSRCALRIDGLIDMGEGLSEDGIEGIAIMVAECADEFVVLTLRTRPADEVTEAVDTLIDSFSLEAAGS